MIYFMIFINIYITFQDASIDEDEEAENNYIKRLTGGLFTLQRIDYILLEVSATSETVKQRVLQILNLRGASMKTIRSIMRGECHDHFNDKFQLNNSKT